VMARYGSDRIRGHGIPEALEAILTRGSRVAPRVALLKPISSAVSIGSGGPFGAEGPIIMSGGAFGSLVAQLFHLTSAERKTLLVAGAAAGMAATFDAPMASVLLAVELLLFELKPRSTIPVALAVSVATIVRRTLLGTGPIFPTPHHVPIDSLQTAAGCVGAGIIAGLVALAMTRAVYFAEDAFAKLPIHWMWWPAIGGLVVGAGGLLCPAALGVGYENIATLLADDMPLAAVLTLIAVKLTIWATALGSGTSGGVLAPLLMMGCAVGAVESRVLPDQGHGFWPLVSMGAILAGTMRVPLTGVLFVYEITRDQASIVPVLIAGTAAYAMTVLALPRSILTEKLSRRGFHVTREYEIDPLEVLFVSEVMDTSLLVLPAEASAADLRLVLENGLYVVNAASNPIEHADGTLVGFASGNDLWRWAASDGKQPLSTLAKPAVAAVHPDESLRSALQRMAQTQTTHLPVFARGETRRLVGVLSLEAVLRARARHREEEERRERVLELPALLPFVPGRDRRAS
jgi:chloride channel protein, CIC family